MEINNLFEFDRLARAAAAKYTKFRFAYNDIKTMKGRRFIALIGPRGAGKTVLLRQLAVNTPDSLYLSLETFEDEDLFGTMRTLAEKYGVRLFLLDEIHFYRDYAAALKKIHDFLDVEVIFTSSVSLSLYETAYDLSRRVAITNLFPLSFREYLFLRHGTAPGALSIREIFDAKWPKEHLKHGHLFKEYLCGGLFPFSFENPRVTDALKGVLEKIVTSDLALAGNLQVRELSDIKKMLAFIGNSPAEDMNYSTLSKNAGVTKYKAQQYVSLLEKAFVLNAVFPAGTSVLREPKIHLCPPFRLLYGGYEKVLGGLREDFAVEALKAAGYGVAYLKSVRGEKVPDFLVEDAGEKYIVEIGGRGKGRRQFKNFSGGRKAVFADGEIFKNEHARPLFLLGFLAARR